MMRGLPRSLLAAALALIGVACARATTGAQFDRTQQLVVVRTADWNTTTGVLQRYVRDLPGGKWTAAGASVPIVVGRTGLAWGDASLASGAQPIKREGDGKSPAGMFPLDTAFGFAPPDSMSALRVPYVPLQQGSDCVDDERSAFYNTVVDRARVARVDWNSAEHMRQIAVYRLGVIVGYNAKPAVPGRGSCIFLHIWSGPSSVTAGCTAMDARELEALMRWLDRDRRPVIVQLPDAEYRRLSSQWNLPTS